MLILLPLNWLEHNATKITQEKQRVLWTVELFLPLKLDAKSFTTLRTSQKLPFIVETHNLKELKSTNLFPLNFSDSSPGKLFVANFYYLATIMIKTRMNFLQEIGSCSSAAEHVPTAHCEDS